jgi:hypothetical protein
MSTLTDPAHISPWLAEDDWSVQSLLLHIAKSESRENGRRIDVLIDTGALITGLANKDVAQFLLHHGTAIMCYIQGYGSLTILICFCRS